MQTRLLIPILAAISSFAGSFQAAEVPSKQLEQWQTGTPIVTYWAGPPLTDAVAQRMAEGGFNLAWCRETDLDVARRHGLRAMLQSELLTPTALDSPPQRDKLDALVARVRQHPALYAYFLTDEPSAAAFPAWGRLVAHLRERDPARLAYINLFPTYANNEQLGTQGDVVTAYREHLRQYVSLVKPALISYDHYQFAAKGDNQQYFLNLSMIQRTAADAAVPFLNIVQACTWTPAMRIPNTNELRYLVSTTTAYGAQGISYYVYSCAGLKDHAGGIIQADGAPTPLFQELKTANRDFVAIAKELQPLRLLGAYHTALREPGCNLLPPDAPFRFDSAQSMARPRGLLLTCFGRASEPSHAMVVNLDYQVPVTATVIGPGSLDVFDATQGAWTSAAGASAPFPLPPGGGKLLRARSK
jgi:hypothetical protein